MQAKKDGLPDTVGIGTHTPNDDPTIDRFHQYDKLLTHHEWACFEGLQYQLRLDLANKRHGKNYNFIHLNPIKWWKLIKLLTSIFTCGGESKLQKTDHGEYSISFLKYVYCILSKFPIPDYLIWADNHCKTMLIKTGIWGKFSMDWTLQEILFNHISTLKNPPITKDLDQFLKQNSMNFGLTIKDEPLRSSSKMVWITHKVLSCNRKRCYQFLYG